MPRALLTFDPERHEYQLDGRLVPGVTRVLDELVDFRFVKREDLERARILGRAVHLACQYEDEGRLDESTVSTIVKPYLEGYRRFLVEVKPQWRGIEEKVCHELHRYAGTLDRRGFVFKKRCTLDIKSGAKSPTVGLQTAAYQEAHDSIYGAEEDTPARFALYLREDATYELVEVKTSRQNDFRTFLSALNLYNWRHTHAA